MNALVAEDANLSWGGGVQRPLVEAGELTILSSAETTHLVQAPDTPTLKEQGINLDLGYKYIIVAPKGMSDDVRDTIATAVAEILNNPESETRKFIEKQYPPAPVIETGDDLRTTIIDGYADNVEMIKALTK